MVTHVVECWEKTSPIVTGELKDEDGNALTAGEVDSVKLRLYNLDDPARAIINARNAVEVLVGAAGTTGEFAIGAGGIFRMKMQALDCPIADATRSIERHMAEFEFTFDDNDGVTRTGVVMVTVNVRNRDKVS